MLERYAKFQFSFAYIKTHLKLGMPLIFSYLLSGSSQYIDGFIASWTTLPSNFAVFRYGAKELPFASSFANGLNNAMLTEFSSSENMRRAMYELKKKSLKLMHYLFPVSIVIMLFSKWIYGNLFSLEYLSGSDVFMVYLLMIICRLVFPQTILIGLKKTKIVFWASFLEILLNIAASLFLMQYYGLVGIALGTTFIHIIEKIFMIFYNYYKLGIPPQAYIPMSWFLFYSTLITMVFVMIDHKLILIF